MMLPVFACAACWEEIAKTSKEDIVFLDKCSISLDGKYKKAWIKWENKEQKNVEDDYLPKKMADSSKTLYYFDCAKKQSTIIQNIYYYHDSAVKSLSINIKEASFDEVIPDTVGEAILEAACGKVKKEKADGLSKSLIHFQSLLNANLNRNNEACWDFLYKNNDYSVSFYNCHIDKITTKNGDSFFKSALKIDFSSEQKFIAPNSDKVYFDSIITSLIGDCDEFINTGEQGYYLNNSFEAAGNYLFFMSYDIFENKRKINKILCKNKTSPVPATEKIKKEQNITKYNLSGSRKIDVIPANFCWNDAYSDPIIDIYYSGCNIDNENGYKKIWVRSVFAKDKTVLNSSNKWVFYDETIEEMYLSCDKKETALLQIYYISPEPNEKIIASVEKENFDSLVFHKIEKISKNYKVVDTLCR